MANRSTDIFHSTQAASEKFDYFITGLTGALFAYMAQTYKPQIFGLDPKTLEPVSLVFLAISFVLGLKRIEAIATAMRLNFQSLKASENAGAYTEVMTRGQPGFNAQTGEFLSPEQAPALRQKSRIESELATQEFTVVAARAHRLYKARNFFLVAGFSAILFAKILPPYFPKHTEAPPSNEQGEAGKVMPSNP